MHVTKVETSVDKEFAHLNAEGLYVMQYAAQCSNVRDCVE
jgi:hypothetical protein